MKLPAKSAKKPKMKNLSYSRISFANFRELSGQIV